MPIWYDQENGQIAGLGLFGIALKFNISGTTDRLHRVMTGYKNGESGLDNMCESTRGSLACESTGRAKSLRLKKKKTSTHSKSIGNSAPLKRFSSSIKGFS
jgi:hypothetical protein